MSHNRGNGPAHQGASSGSHGSGSKKQQQQAGGPPGTAFSAAAKKAAVAASQQQSSSSTASSSAASNAGSSSNSTVAPSQRASPVVTGGWASVAAAGASKASTKAAGATPSTSQQHSRKGTPTATPPPGSAAAPPSNKFLVGGVDLSSSLSLPLSVTVAATGQGSKERELEGVLWTYDARSSMLVLCSNATAAATSPDARSFQLVNTRQVKSVKVLSTTRDRSKLPQEDVVNLSLPSPTELAARADKAVQQDVLRRSKLGPEGVSGQAQQLFDALSKTLPVRWHGKSFVVMDSVLVEEPYRAQDVKAGKDAGQYVERVRKVIEGERQRLGIKAQ
ncbi:hypothetical protein ACM66B_000556 [Microbotryomycetes sp. NB124-2]